MSIFGLISLLFSILSIVIKDFFYVLGNLIRFKRPVGKVIQPGNPGYGGSWPVYKPPQEGDSRSSCPGLNAMANHGILPHNGKAIKFTDLPELIHATYNFSPTFGSAVGTFAAVMLKKDFNKDIFDLEEVSLHNGIEHDASLTRLDTALQPNQAIINSPFVQEVFTFATGKDLVGNPLLTLKDLARTLKKRRAECKAMNKEYSLSLFHRLFGSANTSMLSTIFGGRVDDLQVILTEERIPNGWEPRVREAYGETVLRLNLTGVLLELCVATVTGSAVDASKATGITTQGT